MKTFEKPIDKKDFIGCWRAKGYGHHLNITNDFKESGTTHYNHLMRLEVF